jgi:long-chain acyl-CoA synthetase
MLVVPRIVDTMKRGVEKAIAAAPPRVQKMFAKAMHNASRIYSNGPILKGGLLRMAAHHAFFDPLVFRRIRQEYGGRLRYMISGGAPLDIADQVFFKYLGLPIYQGYGLTEASPVISANYHEVHRLGSSGQVALWLRPENGGDYAFRSEDGNLGKEHKGELLVRGDCVMKGYWRHRDDSAKTLADGWLHTGDLGYVDDDGFLYIEGRHGNMICLVGGEKVHPEHVEDAIKNSELITEAMLIGDGCKNVYVLLNVDADAAARFASPDELQSRAWQEVQEQVEHLAPFQRPRAFLILPEFTTDDETLTVTLKIRRHKIRAKYGDQIRAFLQENGENG